MSENVLSHGIFLKITNGPLNYEEISDILYDKKSIWNINYEGTLLYSDDSDGEAYGIQFHRKNVIDKEDIKILNDLGIEFDESSALAYSCVWYNGTDSDMSEVTLEEYKNLMLD